MLSVPKISLQKLAGKAMFAAACFAAFAFAAADASAQQKKTARTFTNPLLPGGADPYVSFKDGYYYYTQTGGPQIYIRKTKNLADLATAEKKAIWQTVPGTGYAEHVWAPELHFIDNKCYLYFTADNGKSDFHRMFVLENTSPDPMKGEFVFKGQLAAQGDEDKWAIDGSVFENKGQLYMIWSGWKEPGRIYQSIFIAKMKNPYTIEGPRVLLSSAEYDWEKFNAPKKNGVVVNEGPEMLKHGDKLFLIYSASGCWTDHYTLGMLTASNTADLMNPASWKKHDKPVFPPAPENGVYGPGHNGFFKSPDGKEDWILYHANPAPDCGCGGKRSPRIQKFTWNADGTPNFGIPVKTDSVLVVPSEKTK